MGKIYVRENASNFLLSPRGDKAPSLAYEWYIYIYSNFICIIISISSLNQGHQIMQNACQNWTFQCFARVAEKKERMGKINKSDTRQDLNPDPRLVAPMLYRLSYGVIYIHSLHRPKNKEINLKIIRCIIILGIDFTFLYSHH